MRKLVLREVKVPYQTLIHNFRGSHTSSLLFQSKPTNCSPSVSGWTSWPSIPDSPGLLLLVFSSRNHTAQLTLLSSFEFQYLIQLHSWLCSYLLWALPLAWQAFKSESCYALPSACPKAGEDLRFFYVTMYWFCLQRPLLSTPLVKRVALPFGWE